MKKRNRLSIMIILLAVLIITAACADTASDTSGSSTASTSETKISSDNTAMESAAGILSQYADEDTNSSWDESTATKITLDGSAITVDGSGATASESTLTITSAGTYVLSGTLSNGQILIAAAENAKVRLILNGVNITCSTGAPVYAATADKLIITLAGDTQNTVTDGGSAFTYADTAAEEPDAAVFSKCDLSINGAGTLTVNAGFNNGIGTKDDLIVAGGFFTINAANHGLRGRDSVTVLDGTLTITAEGDGIQSNNDEDNTKGWISLEGGVYNITSGHDGIQAQTILSVSGGEYTIAAGGKSSNSSSADTSDSYKGLKSSTDLAVSSGTFVIDSADDCIHTNGNIAITGGSFTLSSGDDGIHADADLTISGGNINVIQSYEGLEGATINIRSGTIRVAASDDGVNAAGGNDSGMGGRFGRDSFESSGSYYINMSGGEAVVNAGGDGFDSNGDINIKGGLIISLINSSPDNGAMDCDGTFTATGGTIIYGGTGAGQVPGGDSAQSYVYINTGIAPNTNVTLQKDGNTLISFTPEISCQYLVFSSPDVINGQSYSVYGGSSQLTAATAGTGGNTGGPGRRGGTKA